MSADDLIEAAGVPSEQHDAARASLGELVERGLMGRAGFAGSSLFFAKKPERRAPRRHAAPAADTPASAGALTTPAPASEPEAPPSSSDTWRPVVIRRRKPQPAEATQAEATPPAPAAKIQGDEGARS